MLIEMASVNPLTVFQLAVAAQQPSFLSFGLIPVAALVGHLAINIQIMNGLASGSRAIIDGCLSKGPSGKTLLVSEVFAGGYPESLDLYTEIEHWLVQFNGLMTWKLDDMIRIHFAPGQGTCDSFPRSQFYVSHIFISNFPRENEPIQRFIFLHEIFHVLFYIVTRPVTHFASFPAHVVFLIWALFFMQWGLPMVFALLAFGIAAMVWHERKHWQLKTLRLLNEIVADAAAIIYSSDSDLKVLRSNRALSKVFRDPELSLAENLARVAVMREHIDMALAGKRDELIERAFSTFSIGTPRVLQMLFLSVVLAASMKVSALTLHQLFIALCFLVTLVLMFLLVFVKYLYFRSQLVSAIENQFPVTPPIS
jgi:hypothetical protein